MVPQDGAAAGHAAGIGARGTGEAGRPRVGPGAVGGRPAAFRCSAFTQRSVVGVRCSLTLASLTRHALSSIPQVQYVALRNISLIVQRRPQILANEVKVGRCRDTGLRRDTDSVAGHLGRAHAGRRRRSRWGLDGPGVTQHVLGLRSGVFGRHMYRYLLRLPCTQYVSEMSGKHRLPDL